MDAKFVKEYAAEKELTRSDQNVLIAMEEWAKQKNMNACDYSKEEILAYFQEHNNGHINTLRKYTSLLRQYTDYCISLKISKTEINACNQITKKDLMSCLKNQDRKIELSTLLELIYKYKNYTDKFILLASYEGLTLSEILSLRDSHFDFNGNYIYHPKVKRWFSHSDLLKTFAMYSLNEYTYLSKGYIVKMEDLDTNGRSFVKKSVNRKVPTSHTIISRIARINSLLDYSKNGKYISYTPKNINKCAFFDAIRYNNYNLPADKFIDNKNEYYRELLERFNRELSRSNVVREEYELYVADREYDEETANFWKEQINYLNYVWPRSQPNWIPDISVQDDGKSLKKGLDK